MLRVLRVLGAATFSLLTLIPSTANASAIDDTNHVADEQVVTPRASESTDSVAASANASRGSNQFSLATSGIRTQAQTYLAALYNAGSSIYTLSVVSVLGVARGDLGQDHIIAKVSEPSTLLVVGVAFLMFAKRARREQRHEEI
jgi:hypothetical protein